MGYAETPLLISAREFQGGRMLSSHLIRIAAIAFAVASAPLAAHHPVRSSFDADRPVTLTGTVTAVEWINPHFQFVVETTDATGRTVAWTVETPAPHALLRRGISRDFLKTGDEVRVEGWPALDGSPRADARVIELPDGQRLEFAESHWIAVDPTQPASIVMQNGMIIMNGRTITPNSDATDVGDGESESQSGNCGAANTCAQ
jgi:hypothetical protein